MKPSWPVVVVACATLGVLSLAAWRGAVSWHAPTWFAVGVLCPAFGLRSRASVAVVEDPSDDPPSSPPKAE